ncbi:phosphotransferase, partial [Pseudomonas sp.]|uniref:phosphotransferase n=1 Tax=Pseudomonas sp. TaxID=306 RepID=UPI0028A7BC5E
MSLSTLLQRSSLPNPILSPAQADDLLLRHYGLRGELQALGSQQDLNLRLDTGQRRFVLKVCHASYAEAELAAQHAALAHLHAAGLPVPQVQAARSGEAL